MGNSGSSRRLRIPATEQAEIPMPDWRPMDYFGPYLAVNAPYYILFSSTVPYHLARGPPAQIQDLDGITMVGAFVCAAEAVAVMMNLYGLDPPCEGLGPGWKRAYGGPHRLQIIGSEAEGPRVGEGYQYLTRRGMAKTIWVQCVRGQEYEGEGKGREGRGTEEYGPSESERIRHDLIPLQYQSEGWRADEVPPMWCAPPWAKTFLPNARNYSDDVDALERGEWRTPPRALPAPNEPDRTLAASEDDADVDADAEEEDEDDDTEIIVDPPAANTTAIAHNQTPGPKIPRWKVIPAFGLFPPKLAALSSNAAMEAQYSGSHLSDRSEQSSSDAQRPTSGPSSRSERISWSRSGDGAVQISSLSSYHSHGRASLSPSAMPTAQDSYDSPTSRSEEAAPPALDDSQKPNRSAEDDDEEKLVRAIANSTERSLPLWQQRSERSSPHLQANDASGVDTTEPLALPHASASSEDAFDEIFGPYINRENQHEEHSERQNVDNQVRGAAARSSDDDVSTLDLHEEESQIITRREPSPENIVAFHDVCAMLSELNGDGEHELPREPVAPPKQPAPSSWAAVASNRNKGKENISLKVLPRASSRGLGLDPKFKVKLHEWWKEREWCSTGDIPAAHSRKR